jgi:hypothetical protein
VAAALVVFLLTISGRYGFHRDELYFIEAGERLAWGYVDQPPLVPVVARLTGPFDHSLFALRLLPALAAGAMAVLAGGFARRFGGGTFAQTLAALATATGGFFLAIGHLLSTTTFDVLIWAVLIYLVVVLVQDGVERLWIAAGVLVGVGLLNKWTVLFVVGGLLLGLAATASRRLLRSPHLWLGVGIALAMWAPNLVWQASNDWPFFDMAESLRAEGLDESFPVLFIPLQLLYVGLLAAPIWIAGLWSLLRNSRMAPYRFIAWAYLLLAIVFMALASKPYFITPFYVALLGAGAVSVEAFIERRRGWLSQRVIAGSVALGGLLALPIGLPILPPVTLADTPFVEINPEPAETYGWEQLVPEIAAAFGALPEDARRDAVVFTSNYGEAGAIDLFGPPLGLPPASSGHNNYWLWGPPDGSPVVIVGRFPAGYLEQRFVGLRHVATFNNRARLANEEHEAPIFIADGPRGSWRAIWPELRHFN